MAVDYRSVQTRMWREDAWFQTLTVEARLFWIYLFTNPSASPAGIYTLPLPTIAFESGVSVKRALPLLDQFAEADKAHYQDGVMWVVNMRRLQFPTLIDGCQEWQIATRIQRDIDTISDRNPLKLRYLEHSGYPTIEKTQINGKTIRTVRIEYPTDKDKVAMGYQYPIDPLNLTKRNITKIDDGVAPTRSDTDPEYKRLIDAAQDKWKQMLTGDNLLLIGEYLDLARSSGHPEYCDEAVIAAMSADYNPCKYFAKTMDSKLTEGRRNGHEKPAKSRTGITGKIADDYTAQLDAYQAEPPALP